MVKHDVANSRKYSLGGGGRVTNNMGCDASAGVSRGLLDGGFKRLVFKWSYMHETRAVAVDDNVVGGSFLD